ncbi:MAG TPA: M28 family peptidase [Solirubrobacteraceae bacterium]
MGTAETVASLAAFKRRGAGSDAERRCALWLSDELRTPRRAAAIETFWCRPNWALACAWHLALALAGSLVSVHSPQIGGALIALALLLLLLDGLTGRSAGRRLTPERASQNVVSRPTGETGDVRLILTANYDAGRTGLVYRRRLRRVAAGMRRWGVASAPGWLGWMGLLLVWLLATAVLRWQGAGGSAIGVAQLIPTAVLVLVLALLLELATSPFGPAASDNASGVAVAVALARALDVAPPPRLSVEVVLQGAGDGAMLGLKRYLREHRRELRPPTAIVLGIGPCGGGDPVWWTSDGSLLPLRYLPRLGAIAARAAGPGTASDARPHRGRGVSPAYPARLAGLPAITIGCLDEHGLAPRSHERGDVPEAVQRDSIDGLLALALTLVDAIDADLRDASDRSAAAPAAA